MSFIGDKLYQEKTVQALLQDVDFAEQMAEVIRPEFFDQTYLHEIVAKLFEYKEKYGAWPSTDVIEMRLRDEGVDDVIYEKAIGFLRKAITTPLNGDMSYIQETSLDFCKKQTMAEALGKAIDMCDDQDYDSVVKVVTDAMSKGESRDIGHEYAEGFDARAQKAVRTPVPTPWGPLNRVLNGGWERKTLTTFIAPTGAGKTHFLCNVSAGAVEAGYDVCYVTLEIADYKVGLRHDAYFSGVQINDIPDEMERVKLEVGQSVKGRLFIKEFPTNGASVQTLRSYLRRLKAMKNFTPDMLVVDYADLLRPSRNFENIRHELEATYKDLRGLAQELDLVLVTADQTNRGGLDQEVVTLSSIAECYGKATVCDLILTISRRIADRTAHTGRLWVAKSRMGPDGMVFPFVMNGALVKATLLDQVEHIEDIETEKERTELMKERLRELMNKKKNGSS